MFLTSRDENKILDNSSFFWGDVGGEQGRESKYHCTAATI
jgi:hypothetical protein